MIEGSGAGESKEEARREKDWKAWRIGEDGEWRSGAKEGNLEDASFIGFSHRSMEFVTKGNDFHSGALLSGLHNII